MILIVGTFVRVSAALCAIYPILKRGNTIRRIALRLVEERDFRVESIPSSAAGVTIELETCFSQYHLG